MKSFLENFRTAKNPPMDEKVSETTATTNVSSETTEVESETTKNTAQVVVENESVTATEPETVESEETASKEQPKRKTIRVCKMGSDHKFANMNNHDFAFNLLNMKIVTDGCGSGKHSEVGTRLFGQLFARKSKEYFDKGESICEENFIEIVNSIFEKMLELCSDTSFIFQNYCFTILVCFEFEDEFVVYSCGDGYIIKENEEGIFFDELDDGEYPCYYIYNFHSIILLFK